MSSRHSYCCFGKSCNPLKPGCPIEWVARTSSSALILSVAYKFLVFSLLRRERLDLVSSKPPVPEASSPKIFRQETRCSFPSARNGVKRTIFSARSRDLLGDSLPSSRGSVTPRLITFKLFPFGGFPYCVRYPLGLSTHCHSL